MINFPLPRIDIDKSLTKLLLPYCRFKKGFVWEDKKAGHKIACIDAANKISIKNVMGNKKASLAIQDPPYNFVAFEERDLNKFIDWSRTWIKNTFESLDENASLYIWLGADQNNHFQPFPEFILMMKDSGFHSRSFITMRNQRGYGTQKNWMSIRQELLYYTKGNPQFFINAEYTDIPKILNGYYKAINGKVTDNFTRGKSKFIRAGNVWVDIQQVFYRMEENINGCYAQKPLKAIKRILEASSSENNIIVDFFSHSGTTLLASEILKRRCFTCDLHPVFCEISLRRLENYRMNNKTGWQNSNPFFKEILEDNKLRRYLEEEYNYKVDIKEFSL